MKKTTSMKSNPKFAKKRANSKQPETKKTVDKKAVHPATDMPKAQANPEPTPPPSDAVTTQVASPTPEVRPCSPAETQKGHHEVVQS